MSLGFHCAGWEVLGVERDGDARRSHNDNVGHCRLNDIRCFHPDRRYDAIIGGPPCQGFSMAGKRRGSDLFLELIRCGVDSGAKALVMENVEGMVSWKRADGVKMPEIVETAMINAGYCPTWRVINCADYGTPQIRKRIIFVAFADIDHAAKWMWPAKSHGPDVVGRPWVSVREALGLGGAYVTGRIPVDGTWLQGARILDVDDGGDDGGDER